MKQGLYHYYQVAALDVDYDIAAGPDPVVDIIIVG